MFTLFISVLLVLGIAYYAGSRKGKVITEKPKQMKSFTIKLLPTELMKMIIDFANQNKYAIAEVSKTENRIILSEGMSLTSYGFFYPIYLSVMDNGATLIEVGIRSKAAQIGPIVNKKHEKIVNGIKAAVFAYSVEQ